MFDLALGKPATQSSKYPEILVPLDVNAANANSINSSDSYCQTNAEWFPWWQVDLEASCLISEIVLYNTSFWPSRMRRFTILISKNGQTWQEVFSKTDSSIFGGDDENAYRVQFAASIIGRFVRVRLDNWDYLHLKRVCIYGNVCHNFPSEEKAVNNKISLPSKIIFSSNYNEDDQFLPIYIDNFLNYTPDNCYLFINFPSSRPIPLNLITPNSRVHIFNGEVDRKKWGGTLLLGHMESYREALNVLGKIDYFCTCATNGLFVKLFDLKAAVQRLELNDQAPVGMTRNYLIDVPLNNIPRGKEWIWDNLLDSKSFREYLLYEADIKFMSLNQIEGLFASGAEWNTLYSRIEILKKSASYFPYPNIKTPALEEFLPVTFFRRFGSGKFTNICHMLWDPHRDVTFLDLIEFAVKLPVHMCQVKWFNRNPDTLPTAALDQKWFRALLDDLLTLDTPNAYRERFLKRLLTQSFSEASRLGEVYTPLTRFWRSEAQEERAQWMCSSLIPVGKQVKLSPAFSTLSIGPSKNGSLAAWLLSSDSPVDTLHYEAIISEEASTTTLSLQVNKDGEPSGRHEWGDTRATLFLSPMVGEKAQVFRLSLRRPFEFVHEQIMHNIRLSDGHSNLAWPLTLQEDEEGWCHFYFLRPQNHFGEIWIGIPAFLRTSISMKIAFGISPI
ncbi:discoidin domain-containing protein [Oecophyllibacter saccharovorans]|uniref:Discoidin domain-containing protein n=1 Tax=Oecophyllibacter saccharovorans TaxID=2558360 RepID=A0A506URZ6_9PROT|nr:discoidin domain-containing protein [Oecophyllibacter saccharovorans]TPW36082.1 discoidin domain-containing protein [Oecophyllibacter saccharovorans]